MLPVQYVYKLFQPDLAKLDVDKFMSKKIVQVAITFILLSIYISILAKINKHGPFLDL